jgi:L-serine dehydratase
MFLSVFDLFKIGIGPSSSHTIGPLRATRDFLQRAKALDVAPVRITVTLHGSLAFTGKGHATDRACFLGLCGLFARSYDPDNATKILRKLMTEKRLPDTDIAFDPNADLRFDFDKPLSGHANGLRCVGLDADGAECLSEVYYSIGGGFILTQAELNDSLTQDVDVNEAIPFPFKSADQMLEMAKASGLSIAQMKRANEAVFYSDDEIESRLDEIWQAMSDCISRGMNAVGHLPGGLNVPRRARAIKESLEAQAKLSTAGPHVINDWISVYAMAVNEENAAGGQVVTAPTNGAAGVLPASIHYWREHVPDADRSKTSDFLLTAAAIAGLIKHNASISGAECGCQAEVGSAAAMGAAGFCAVMGGTPKQVENAAEIALEHHLGMTCDPVAGLVQVPCIERNGLGAIKAVSAASLALRGDGSHFVPLDSAIATLRQTGRDMHDKYKETSLGGLAVNVPNC